MIEKCLGCGRLRVRREPYPVVEGDPVPGPTMGVAWLLPADERRAKGGPVSYGYCPRCRKAEMEKAEARMAQADADAVCAANAEVSHTRLFGTGEEVVT